VYSVDEVFIDITGYLHASGLNARSFTMMLVREVLDETGITATAGIGENMYLAKVAMDIVAKHAQPDAMGVRMAFLDEMGYRRLLWTHEPLTDF
jgi:DNA polymerase V